jgi:hypothetical protein
LLESVHLHLLLFCSSYAVLNSWMGQNGVRESLYDTGSRVFCEKYTGSRVLCKVYRHTGSRVFVKKHTGSRVIFYFHMAVEGENMNIFFNHFIQNAKNPAFFYSHWKLPAFSRCKWKFFGFPIMVPLRRGVVKNRRVPVCFLNFQNENGAVIFVFFIEKAIFQRAMFGPNCSKTGGQFGSPK